MSVTVHAVQTGRVQVKRAQRERKPGGLLRVLTDAEWSEWMPIYAWVIDHPEGIIVVDTGETARSMEPDYFPHWHPYYRRAVRMDVRPEEEIGPQLKAMGIQPADVKTLVLTHLHTDHTGGLHHFPQSTILVSGRDYRLARGFSGKLSGYLPHRWPTWFEPQPIGFRAKPVGSFDQSCTITPTGDVIIVPTPGHTPGHLSVLVETEDVTFFLAGDTSYDQALLSRAVPDGVSPKVNVTLKTMGRILALAHSRPLVYLPAHDPQSAERLQAKQVLEVVVHSPSQGKPPHT